MEEEFDLGNQDSEIFEDDFGDLESHADNLEDEEDNEETGQEEAQEESEEPAEEDGQGDEEEDDEQEAVIQLKDGQEVSLAELSDGYLRKQDYTTKTMELADERKAVSELKGKYGEELNKLQSSYDGILGFVQSILPPEPDISLLRTNPAEHQYQTVMRNQALGELRAVMGQKEVALSDNQALGTEEIEQTRRIEDGKLTQVLPFLRKPGELDKFNESIKATAKEFGFSDQEFEQSLDHRVKKLVHFAAIGMKSDANRKNAKRRVAKPMPKTGKAVRPGRGQSDAMKRLRNSGSMEDAMETDFY
jgi:hypothetical protein